MRLRTSAAVAQGLERLCRHLGDSGFQVAVADITDRQATLVCPTCPLRPVVRQSSRAAAIDRGMWAGLAAGAIEGIAAEEVACSTEGCSSDHSTCRIVLRLETTAATNAGAPP
jgi:hypothetical protein